jgi:hypothetical protein
MATMVEGNTYTITSGDVVLRHNYSSYIGIRHKFPCLGNLPQLADVQNEPALIVDMFLAAMKNNADYPSVVNASAGARRGWRRKRDGKLYDKPGQKYIPGLLAISPGEGIQAIGWLACYGFEVHSPLSRKVLRILGQLSDQAQVPTIAPSYYKVELLPLPWRRSGTYGVIGSGRKAPGNLAEYVYNASRMTTITLRHFEPCYERRR